MYTEEVSVGPTIDHGGRGYRRPVADLVRGRRIRPGSSTAK
jgi:uncharacterized protein